MLNQDVKPPELLNIRLPNTVFLKYFKSLKENVKMFLPVMVQDDKPMIYLENSAEKHSLCRIFLSEEEVNLYITMVCTNNKKISEDSMRYWEIAYNDLIGTVDGMALQHFKNSGRYIRCQVYKKYDNKFKTLDVLWTNDETIMI